MYVYIIYKIKEGDEKMFAKDMVKGQVKKEIKKIMSKLLPVGDRDREINNIFESRCGAFNEEEKQKLIESCKNRFWSARRIQREESMKNSYVSKELPFEVWLEKARSLYDINEQCAVVSKAMGDDHLRTWECECNEEAKDKIDGLIYMMYYNHFKRDGQGTIHNFMNKSIKI